jgi:hypothetical protein
VVEGSGGENSIAKPRRKVEDEVEEEIRGKDGDGRLKMRRGDSIADIYYLISACIIVGRERRSSLADPSAQACLRRRGRWKPMQWRRRSKLFDASYLLMPNSLLQAVEGRGRNLRRGQER